MKRYYIDSEDPYLVTIETEDENGDWVRHEEAKTEIAKLRERIMDPHESMEVDILIDENKELKAENAKLREAIGKAVDRLPAFPEDAERYLSKILKEDEE